MQFESQFADEDNKQSMNQGSHEKDDILSQSWVSRLSPKLEHLFGALDL